MSLNRHEFDEKIVVSSEAIRCAILNNLQKLNIRLTESTISKEKGKSSESEQQTD